MVVKVTDNREKLFKRWIEEYKNLLFKVVKTYASTREDRDDLFQEILMQLYISVPNFRGDAV